MVHYFGPQKKAIIVGSIHIQVAQVARKDEMKLLALLASTVEGLDTWPRPMAKASWQIALPGVPLHEVSLAVPAKETRCREHCNRRIFSIAVSLMDGLYDLDARTTVSRTAVRKR